MNSTIKVIIFDFGNVLIDWDPRNLYKDYFLNDPEGMESFLSEVDFMKWNAEQDRGRSFKDGINELATKFPKHSHLIRAFHENWERSIGNVHWDTVDIMKELKQAGYPLYGLSNWSMETFPRTRKKYNFFDLFDDIILSGEVKHVKPDPEIYHIMLERIKRQAKECLFIDDSLPNIYQANTIGFATIQYQNTTRLRIDLENYGVISPKANNGSQTTTFSN